MIGVLGDHLWQSTLCAQVVALVTLALRRNRAHVRYWLWLAASVKFLVPCAALVAAGRQFGWLAVRPLATSDAAFAPGLTLMIDANQPFSVTN